MTRRAASRARPRSRRRSKARVPPLRRLLRLLLAMAALGVLLSALAVAALRFVPPPFTVSMLAGRLCAGAAFRPPDYRWVPLERIAPDLRRAVLAGEDQRFLDHHGFDFVELRHAVADALDGQRLRGASTLSMQAARSVFLVPRRRLWRKAAEAYFTVLVELLWGKRRILEVYLNTVDWGDGILGAEAAARTYFGADARGLTRHQAALLAAVLPNPHRWSPRDPSPHVRERQGRILQAMERMPLVR